MSDLLKDLLSHQAWADAVFFQTWAGSEVLADEELRARTDHLLGTQEAFLQVLNGAVVEIMEHPLPAFGDLLTRSRCNHGLLETMGQVMDKEALARKVCVPWFPDPPCVVSVADALAQVCLHGQHHRAQSMTRLKALGVKPRNVDYIIWLWKQKPGPRWPG